MSNYSIFKNVNTVKNSFSMRIHFTMVELITVIGIIAVLVSLLLPALSKARGQVKVIACSSNLKQITMGLISCCFDNGDRIVPARIWDSDATHNNRKYDLLFSTSDQWSFIAQNYIFGNSASFSSTWSQVPAQVASGIIKCPASTVKPTYLTYIHYGMPAYGIGGAAWGKTTPDNLNKLNRPSAMAFLVDTADYSQDGASKDLGVSARGSYLAYNSAGGVLQNFSFIRHGGKNNIGHVDGHVSTYTQQKLVDVSYKLSTTNFSEAPLGY